MTEQVPGRRGDEPESPELEFARRWRSMINRVGGGSQARAAKHLNWTSSTVSRDYKGDTLPTEDRLFQLSSALQLPHRELLELASLLRRSRAARLGRRRPSHAELSDPPAASPAATNPDYGLAQPTGTAKTSGPHHSATPPGPRARLRGWFRSRRGLAAVLLVGVVAAVIGAILGLRLSGSPAPPQSPVSGATASSVLGSFPGTNMDVVQIPLRSLTPALAAEFRQGRTAHAAMVTGFVFRNQEMASLCLTVPDTGAEAGHNRDPIVVSTCRGTQNQVWIPLQWEVKGIRFTHLVSDRYQSMCLNANNLGGMSNGHIVELWDCYAAGNEAWDFGDWYTAVGAGTHSYPIFARNGRLCLDADKWDLRDGTSVRIWTQYPTANQFWS